MTNPPVAETLNSADRLLLQEVLRQAEIHIQSQLTAAIAADQRAYSFTAVTLASVVLLAGGCYSLLSVEHPNTLLAALCGLLAAALFAAAWIGCLAGRSVKFDFAGSQPAAWCGDVIEGKELRHALAEQCEHYQETIAANRASMETNGRLFNFAVTTALTSTGLAGLACLGYLAYRNAL